MAATMAWDMSERAFIFFCSGDIFLCTAVLAFDISRDICFMSSWASAVSNESELKESGMSLVLPAPVSSGLASLDAVDSSEP